MTQLADLFPPADLQAEIDTGYVTRKRHPTLPISILTYGRTCQFENRWNHITTRTRGLVVDDADGRIVAHCLPKFFNHDQHGAHDFAPVLPDEPFEVYDKIDGSLGQVFHYAGSWRAASKGSFISEQATWAQAWLDNADTGALVPGFTYVTEILYPENRIVVNNGTERTLVLLAVYDEHGEERPLAASDQAWGKTGGRVVRSWAALPLAEIVAHAARDQHLDDTAATGTDAEGWVIRFASGLRTKCKIKSYIRLHRVLTGTNARDIWRHLGAEQFGPALEPKALAQVLGCSAAEAATLAAIPGGALSKLLEQVPDEFDAWVRSVQADLQARFAEYAAAVTQTFTQLAPLAADRGAFARAAADIDDRTVRAAMFATLDGKSVDTLIWKAIRPEPTDPFRNDEEG
jgi:RNA ligase